MLPLRMPQPSAIAEDAAEEVRSASVSSATLLDDVLGPSTPIQDRRFTSEGTATGQMLTQYRSFPIIRLIRELAHSFTPSLKSSQRAMSRWKVDQDEEGPAGRMHEQRTLTDSALQRFFHPLVSHRIANRRKGAIRNELRNLVRTARNNLVHRSPTEGIMFNLLLHKLLGLPRNAGSSITCDRTTQLGAGFSGDVTGEEIPCGDGEDDSLNAAEMLLYVILRTSVVGNTGTLMKDNERDGSVFSTTLPLSSTFSFSSVRKKGRREGTPHEVVFCHGTDWEMKHDPPLSPDACWPRWWLTPSTVSLLEGSHALRRAMMWGIETDAIVHATLVPEPVVLVAHPFHRLASFKQRAAGSNAPPLHRTSIASESISWGDAGRFAADVSGLFSPRKDEAGEANGVSVSTSVPLPPIGGQEFLSPARAKEGGPAVSEHRSVGATNATIFKEECPPEVVWAIYVALHRSVVGIQDPHSLTVCSSCDLTEARLSPSQKISDRIRRQSFSPSRLKRFAFSNPVVEEPRIRVAEEFLTDAEVERDTSSRPAVKRRKREQDDSTLRACEVPQAFEECWPIQEKAKRIPSRGVMSLLHRHCVIGTLARRLQRLCELAEMPERKPALGNYGQCAMDGLRDVLTFLQRRTDELLHSRGRQQVSFEEVLKSYERLEHVRESIVSLAVVFDVTDHDSWDASLTLQHLSSATLLSKIYHLFSVRYHNSMGVATVASKEDSLPVLDVVGYLLRSVFYPLQRMLTAWLTRGECHDPFDEFFIVPSHGTSFSGFTTDCSPHRLPSFISEDAASALLEAGISLRVLQEASLLLKSNTTTPRVGEGTSAMLERIYNFAQQFTGRPAKAPPCASIFTSQGSVLCWKEYYSACDEALLPRPQATESSSSKYTAGCSSDIGLNSMDKVEGSKRQVEGAASEAYGHPITVCMDSDEECESEAVLTPAALERRGADAVDLLRHVHTRSALLVHSTRARQWRQRLEEWKSERRALQVFRRRAIDSFISDVQRLCQDARASGTSECEEERHAGDNPWLGKLVVPLPGGLRERGGPPVILYPTTASQTEKHGAAKSPTPLRRLKEIIRLQHVSAGAGVLGTRNRRVSVMVEEPPFLPEVNEKGDLRCLSGEKKKKGKKEKAKKQVTANDPSAPKRPIRPARVEVPPLVDSDFHPTPSASEDGNEEAYTEVVEITLEMTPETSTASTSREPSVQDEENAVLFVDEWGYAHHAANYIVADINDDTFFMRRNGPRADFSCVNKAEKDALVEAVLDKEAAEQQRIDVLSPAYISCCEELVMGGIEKAFADPLDCPGRGSEWRSDAARLAYELDSNRGVQSEVHHPECLSSGGAGNTVQVFKDSLTAQPGCNTSHCSIEMCSAYYSQLGVLTSRYLTERAFLLLLMEPCGVLYTLASQMLDVCLMQSPSAAVRIVDWWLPKSQALLLDEEDVDPLEMVARLNELIEEEWSKLSGAAGSRMMLQFVYGNQKQNSREGAHKGPARKSVDSRSRADLLGGLPTGAHSGEYADDEEGEVGRSSDPLALLSRLSLRCLSPPGNLLWLFPDDVFDDISDLFCALLMWKSIEQLVTHTWKCGVKSGVADVFFFINAAREVFLGIQQHLWDGMSRACYWFRTALQLDGDACGSFSTIGEFRDMVARFMRECRHAALLIPSFHSCRPLLRSLLQEVEHLLYFLKETNQRVELIRNTAILEVEGDVNSVLSNLKSQRLRDDVLRDLELYAQRKLQPLKDMLKVAHSTKRRGGKVKSGKKGSSKSTANPAPPPNLNISPDHVVAQEEIARLVVSGRRIALERVENLKEEIHEEARERLRRFSALLPQLTDTLSQADEKDNGGASGSGEDFLVRRLHSLSEMLNERQY